MTTIRARLSTQPPTEEVAATGNTLAHAVRNAARQLGLCPGVSHGGVRTGTHGHEWTWEYRRQRYTIVVRESRSGPSGESTRAKVLLSLGDAAVVRLDELARESGRSKSGVVEALILGATSPR